MHGIFLILDLIGRLAKWGQRTSRAESAETWDNGPDDHGAASPWWRAELSGFHLLLWMGLPFLAIGVYLDRDPKRLPLWMDVVGGFLMLGWFIKVMFWFVLANDDDDRAIGQYRWFGTAAGTLAASAFVSFLGLLIWYAFQW